jgi:hypothetical protein
MCAGDDSIHGGPGSDRLDADSGDDRIMDVRGHNRIHCAEGIDRVLTNQRSKVSSCERVTRR